MSDGIEIHFDRKRGYIELACEPDAFRPFGELVRTELADFDEIPMDEIKEIQVLNTEAVVRGRSSTRRRLIEVAVCAFVLLAMFFAVVGLVTTIKWLRG